MTLWTLTRGDLYLIQASSLTPTTGYASFVWNGLPDEYRQSWMPENIARDAVGVDATAGATCSEISGLSTDPGGMLNYLKRGQSGVAPACRESVAKFERERAAWTQRLGL
jgi:hypothetical protein